MMVSIGNAIWQTWIVVLVLGVSLLVTVRRKTDSGFSLSTTAELKGLAIFLVVLSHIGYFLVNDHRFLAPLSNYAGVGVDLFLILSGYGLVTASLKKPLSIKEFYRRRLTKVYVPMVVTLLIFLFLDALVINRYYPLLLTLKNIFGFFPQADLYNNINSPLWFLTPLLVYYLIFPWVFRHGDAFIAATLLALGGYVLVQSSVLWKLGVDGGVIGLYKLHFLGFPLGMAVGALNGIVPGALLKHAGVLLEIINKHVSQILRIGAILSMAAIWFYFSLHPGVGAGWKVEQNISLAMALAAILIFISKNFEFKLLKWFGDYSFEIYLLHWPLLYRYDWLYRHLPASLATILYLIGFLGLGFVYKKILALSSGQIKPLKNTK